MTKPQSLLSVATSTIKDAIRISLDLFKIMVPVIIIVKILQELNLIGYLAAPLAPFMKLVGLPGEMGLVWATALINNIYSGLIVFLSLVQDQPLTAAQATILGTMMLVAHALPVELRVVQSSGPKLIFQLITRFAGAFIFGLLLHLIYDNFNLLQSPANIILTPENAAVDKTILQWAFGEIKNLISIFGIILSLLAVMRILAKLRILAAMDFLLRPLLTLMGIGSKASALTVVGLTMGLSYGGGMIIHETKSGRIDKKDVFYSLTLMSLCHSLIEDTLLLTMIGGHISGLFWGRLIFSIITVAAIVQITKIIPESFSDKYLWGLPKNLVTERG
ncbi:nucleoside recognition domain-containing protein [Maridesulfovibrio zosterae]|uniref:nucleoside recognition domain-containing protein n=1 Tax=Maridesulfovibrio zosterae TaxID=82171 RepID=UPI000407CFEF|nr:nucleoside recognition domain-containing protein [Maridesulfovibrio zosterae]